MADDLGPEDFSVLREMLLSPDEGTRKQAAGLSQKLTPAEQQSFFDYQKANAPSERNRADNSVLGFPPEFAALSGLAIGRAIGGAGLSAAGRAGAGAKAFASQAAPVVKYEITHRALSAMGVPAPVAYALAFYVSGYKSGAKAPESTGAVSAEGFPRGGTTPAPEPPPPSDAPHMDMSQRIPAGALTQAQIGERLAAVNAQGGPSTLPPQAVEALGRTRAARQAAAGDAAAAPTSISEPAAPVSQPASDVPQPQASQPTPKPMSRQQTLNELALAARRAKISLNGEDYGALQVAVRDGMTPVEAVAALAKARMSPIEQLAGSGSFAGLPSEADVAAAVAKRNNSGQWKPPTADARARWQAAREKQNPDQWFHGTSTESGLRSGDYIDPSRGNFESTVWASSDKSHADSFAKDLAAIGSERAKPITYKVNLSENAKIKTVRKVSSSVEDDIASARNEGFDALRIIEGENGKPELAILSNRVASVKR